MSRGTQPIRLLAQDRARWSELENPHMREIPLTKGLKAIVDDEDYSAVGDFTWCAVLGRGTRKFYVKRTHTYFKDGVQKQTTIWLHRLIMGAPKGMVVDHIDGDPLNNRRSNMRVITNAQNLKNQKKPTSNGRGAPTSSYKGVSRRYDGKWDVQICSDRVRYKAGPYITEVDAAFAYDELAKKHHGEFACLNFPA